MKGIFIILLLAIVHFSSANICDSGLQYCVNQCIGCGKVLGVCTNPLCIGNCKDEYCVGGCTPEIPICDAIDGLQSFYENLKDEYDELSGELSDLIYQYTDLVNAEASALSKIAYLSENNLMDFFEDVESGFEGIMEFFADADVTKLFNEFAVIGKEFSKAVAAIGSVDFDVNVLKNVESGLIKSADSIFGWIMNTLAVPSAGVFSEAESDCWWEALNDGTSISWSMGLSTGPSLGLGLSFAGNKPLKCFLQKIRLFGSALAKTEPEFPGLDPIIALREALVSLRNVARAVRLGNFNSDGSRPSWCNSSMFVNVNIPETPYDWVNVLAEGIEKINYIIGEDGALGVTVGAIKSIVCDAATIPSEIENWVDGVLDNLESRKTHVPSALVNRMFNAISNFGEKFNNDLATFEEDYLGSEATGKNCFLDNWSVGNITLTFTLALEIDIFPPKPANIGVGFSCLGLECWSCVTGLDSVIELASGKRALLITRQSPEGSGGGTIEFISGDFSNVGLNDCVEYLCDDGQWNENICTCNCTDVNDLWTPQYGCFNRFLYEAGAAPLGANANANPNNPNYDETVDPWSENYDASKDTDPFYNPYELASSTTHTILIALAVILSLL